MDSQFKNDTLIFLARIFLLYCRDHIGGICIADQSTMLGLKLLACDNAQANMICYGCTLPKDWKWSI